MEKFDVVVIGGGPGGYPAAIRAAQLGVSVGLIEREALGGTCLNWGCIPTKALISSSSLYHHASHGADLGVKTGPISFDYSAMIRRKDEVVSRLKGGVAQLLKANGVKVFEGAASFAGRGKIEVRGKDNAVTSIEAGRVIIATGSTSVMPGFLPVSDRVVESKNFLALTKLPAKMIVLGGGVIGCELACMAAQLGVKVTIVEMLEDILMVLDKDVRQTVRNSMEKELGIEIITGAPLEKISADAKKVQGSVSSKTLEADLLLVSIGRKPVTDGLALEKAGLSVNERGFIETDKFCRTKVATIYAIGDVTAGSTQLAHAATAQGVAAAENACGRSAKAGAVVPACIFTAPEVGSAGLTEQEAKKQNRNVKVGKYMFASLGKAMAAGETTGFVKWVTDAETDQLLGAQAVGAHATELISEAIVAISAELTAEEIGRTIHCHPTFSEAWMEAAHAVHGQCIHAAPKRK